MLLKTAASEARAKVQEDEILIVGHAEVLFNWQRDAIGREQFAHRAPRVLNIWSKAVRFALPAPGVARQRTPRQNARSHLLRRQRK
jgi:hypothetical protein